MVQSVPQSPQESLQASAESQSAQIREILCAQRAFFDQGSTQPVAFRLTQLKALKQAILDHQPEILAALKADLNKPELEAYLTEIGVTQEINYAIKHLRDWAKTQVGGPCRWSNCPPKPGSTQSPWASF